MTRLPTLAYQLGPRLQRLVVMESRVCDVMHLLHVLYQFRARYAIEAELALYQHP